MKRGRYRHAIFAVVYSVTNGKIEYALLKRKKHWIGWEFVKGKIERFETKRMAAKREAKEETGLKLLKIKKFPVHGNYLYHEKLKDRPNVIGQTYHLFAIEAKKGKIKIDRTEHSGAKWADFKEAMKKLKWQDQKKCLKIVDSYLKRR
jgi:8-oxo-dGTP pyrophosphatase MutT (NUDIX family)